MNTILLISTVLLWIAVLVLGFLLLGTLRSMGLLEWRLDELEVTRPVRKGREGLAPGKQAPDFTLPAAAGGDVSLSDFAGQNVLLVFTQAGCGPCHDVMPELNRLQEKGEQQVLVVNNGDLQHAQEMHEEFMARFPIVTQGDWAISKQYQVFATPYAFVVDEQGVIAAKGVAGTPQYLRYIFDAAEKHTGSADSPPERDSTVESSTPDSVSSREVIHA